MHERTSRSAAGFEGMEVRVVGRQGTQNPPASAAPPARADGLVTLLEAGSDHIDRAAAGCRAECPLGHQGMGWWCNDRVGGRLSRLRAGERRVVVFHEAMPSSEQTTSGRGGVATHGDTSVSV